MEQNLIKNVAIIMRVGLNICNLIEDMQPEKSFYIVVYGRNYDWSRKSIFTRGLWDIKVVLRF